MAKQFPQLYDEFVEVLKKRSEPDAKRFLADNFADFPEPIQEDITLILLNDALDNALARGKIVTEGLAELNDLEKLERKLGDQLKALELSE